MYPDYNIKADGTEINSDMDLRSIFDSMLEGTEGERPRGYWVVHQSLLRNKEGEPIKSPYTYKITKEGKHTDRGPNTTRTGFLCTEQLIRVSSQPASRMIMDETNIEAGEISQTRDIYFISSKYDVKEDDILVHIELEDNGDPKSPITPTEELEITKLYPMRSDNGRTEFYIAISEDQK